jgi:hypothetical protein
MTEPGPEPKTASADSIPTAQSIPPAPAAELTRKERKTNALRYTLIICLGYVAAPVAYVDVIHAALCDKLGASRAVANLPTAAGAFFGVIPLFVAWLLPQTRLLRGVSASTFLASALVCLPMSAALVFHASPTACIILAVLNGGVLLAAAATTNIYLWEILMRATTEADRGKTFSIAFGAGPVLAAAASEGAHWVLRGSVPALAYPYNFALLFILAALLMAACATLCLGFHIPLTAAVTAREPLAHYMFGGFKTFFGNRTLLILTGGFLLYWAAFFTMNNASLNVKEVLSVAPEKLSGRIDAIRFGTKAGMGFLLGYILRRFGTRAPCLLTTLALLLASLWALTVPGWAYLCAFGLFGAGELGGFYYPYYAAAVSKPERVKPNTAILSITALLGLLFAGLHGFVADHLGMKPSLCLAIGAAIAALLLIKLLPSRPQPTA